MLLRVRREGGGGAAGQDAAAKGFQLFITPSRPNVPKGGGCAILVPKESIEAAKGEQHHDAIDRITKSVRFLKKWKHNYVSIQMTIDGTKYKLISAYAPQDKNERVNFMTDMTTAITPQPPSSASTQTAFQTLSSISTAERRPRSRTTELLSSQTQ